MMKSNSISLNKPPVQLSDLPHIWQGVLFSFSRMRMARQSHERCAIVLPRTNVSPRPIATGVLRSGRVRNRLSACENAFMLEASRIIF
jgi:hypothetical protein